MSFEEATLYNLRKYNLSFPPLELAFGFISEEVFGLPKVAKILFCVVFLEIL
jgi:hypothetical protein